MSWKRLILTTFVASGLFVGAVTLMFPKPAAGYACGEYTGPQCHSNCVRECTNGSCCEWEYEYIYVP